MPEQEDLQSAIDNIHNSLIGRTDSIISALSDSEKYSNLSTQWVEYANQLHRLVPDYAVPAWLREACGTFGAEYLNDQSNRTEMARFVTARTPEIQQPILVGEAATLNLEQLFADQSERFQLETVFENLVSQLSELISADVIDNRTVHDSLQRLNALFRRAKKGSLATVLLTMNFGRFFLKSFGDSLKANKYAKPFIENFETEFAEASETVQKAEEEAKKEMILKLINPARIDLFIESNPDLKDTIFGFLPAPRDEDSSESGRREI